MATEQLSEETVKYLEEKQIAALMEHLYHDLLLALPADPVDHLIATLNCPMKPQIIIAGPPAGGKGTQCEKTVEKFGVVHISTGDLLREESRKGTPLGKQAQQFMTAGQLVPDALITQLVKAKLNEPDVKQKGWLLDGFPRTRSQALGLQLLGIIPHVVVLLDVADAVVSGRIEGRRVDKDGKTYHVVHNPPPAGLEVHQRPDDTATAIAVRLKLYHQNVAAVKECYSSIVRSVDGDRDKDAVFADVSTAIEEVIVA